MEDLNDDLDGPPNVNEASVINAYFDFIPEDVSVTVNAEDVMEVESAASMFDVANADDVDVDSLSSTSSHIGDTDHPFPELDLMLALRHWNIESHNSRDAMYKILRSTHSRLAGSQRLLPFFCEEYKLINWIHASFYIQKITTTTFEGTDCNDEVTQLTNNNKS